MFLQVSLWWHSKNSFCWTLWACSLWSHRHTHSPHWGLCTPERGPKVSRFHGSCKAFCWRKALEIRSLPTAFEGRGSTALVKDHWSVLCKHSFSLHMFCTSFSQQQVYQPVPHKLDCCYFSGFRVLKLYFKPTVNDFTVLLFHKPLITGNDSLLDGMKCLQAFLSLQLAPLLSQAGGGASAAQLPRAGQDKVVAASAAQPHFQPAFPCLP